ncbi:hypothetical protein UNSWDHB_755 [Dehalobacter sp. UNSWDHB]|nr:hypothetical protein UNSWDHB_2187 [Dehalobacter sp. UNSWDHB]EQB20617.1 hypothetical protein UNSWDHB_2069 [Dehalobacter sp. UNSWDHB]EQB21925.1 hypothetical protein UNSWDHB_755 [Dehalobacter sp. UNSWDHB]
MKAGTAASRIFGKQGFEIHAIDSTIHNSDDMVLRNQAVDA